MGRRGGRGARVPALFFAGLALTFVLVAILPSGPGRRRWAWIPAAALAALAVLIVLEATALLSVLDYLWPLALIAGGGALRRWALRRRHTAERLEGSGERPPPSSEERATC